MRLFVGSRLFQNQIDIAKSGVGIEHFGPTHLNRMMLILPPVDEQHAIHCACVDAIEPLGSAATRVRHQIDLLQEYRTRLIADVVTGKLDVREAATALPEVDPLAADDGADDPLDAGDAPAFDDGEAPAEVMG